MVPRQAGDPIPKELVKQLRLRSELSPAELAARLGMNGGEALVKQWEEGQAVCAGPAAELLLHLLLDAEEAKTADFLLAEASAAWRRSGSWSAIPGAARRGVVSLAGRQVGVLEETTWGSRFTYDAEYLNSPGRRAIAPTLPLRQASYESRGLLPFFANLLPEGVQLELIAQQHKIDRNDAFGLLLATGVDTVGAVEIRPGEPR